MLFFRWLLAALIPDVPEWITEEIKAMKNRVKQIQTEIDNKKIEQINDEVTPTQLVDDCLKKLHPDRDLSSLLVGKLLKGANKFMKLYHDLNWQDT